MFANLLERCPGVTILAVTVLAENPGEFPGEPRKTGVLVDVLPGESQKLIEAIGQERVRVESISKYSDQAYLDVGFCVTEADVIHARGQCPKPCALCENKRRADEWHRRFHDEN